MCAQPAVISTQVAIVGAGPSGLLLSQILAAHGVQSVIIEDRSREYVEGRIRAGVLEHGAVNVLTEFGVGERLLREGMRHDGVYLQWPGERKRIDFREACGQSVWVYGQTEVTKDLIAARLDDGQPIHWEASEARILDVETDRPRVTFVDANGDDRVIEADYVAGCDGFHGVSRSTIPRDVRTVHQRTYPCAWLGILASVPPSTDELIYALHPDGFAMHSMRSSTVSRLYLQVNPEDDLADWPDERIWSELRRRLAIDGWNLASGPTLDKSITPMRSFVSAPMSWGSLYLAGDASHIVPPTGAKGLNLAIADVKRLGVALAARYDSGSKELLNRYSSEALERVWQATYFSWWMTSMLHAPSSDDPDREFLLQVQQRQLRHVTTSSAARAALAENYTGCVLPYP